MVLPILEEWPAAVSIRSHLDDAANSILMNLARAVLKSYSDRGIYLLECSLGSVLECAACMDIGRIKDLMEPPMVHEGKRKLQEVARLTVGLRKSWSNRQAEPEGDYALGDSIYFSHENLHVYQRSLELYEELQHHICSVCGMRDKYIHQLDATATSLVLNIAEGNGRFSKRDQSKFLDLAEEAGTKMSTYLDLMEVLASAGVNQADSLLLEVMAMLNGMKESVGKKA